MPKIALTLAGGVSLGSFEAGALTELLYALDRLNREAGERRWVLDVMTGGSAGSLTAALMARTMLYDLPGRKRHLFRAWVEEADVDRLLEGAPPNAILSNRALRRIAEMLLSDEPFRVVEPASFAPQGGELLRLSFSLANMAGVDYSIPYFTPERGRFVSTFHRDVFQHELAPADLPDRAGWERLAEAAIASGAFPGAFPPQEVDRTREDYPEADASPLIPGRLPFLDGGIFDNEPLREALHHARRADGGRVDEDRLFVLVDPSLNRSSQRPVDLKANLGDHLLRLALMVFGEGRAQDWIRAQRINERLGSRRALAECLAELCATAELSEDLPDRLGHEVAELQRRQEELLPPKLAGGASDVSPPTDEGEAGESEYAKEARRQFPGLARRLEEQTDERGTERWRLFTSTLRLADEVANLEGKGLIRPVLIGSEEDRVAGDDTFSFAGFFYRPWREYDFRIGRIEAHEVLTEVLGDYPPEPGVDDYAIPPAWESFAHARLSDAPADVRRRFRRRVAHRLVEVLEPYVPGYLQWVPLRKTVERWVVESLVAKALGV